MNRNDLATEVSTRSKLTRADATRTVELVFTTIAEALQKGEEVKIVGFHLFQCLSKNEGARGDYASQSEKAVGVGPRETRGIGKGGKMLWFSCDSVEKNRHGQHFLSPKSNTLMSFSGSLVGFSIRCAVLPGSTHK